MYLLSSNRQSDRPLVGLKILNPLKKSDEKEPIQDRVSNGGIGTISVLASMFELKHLVYRPLFTGRPKAIHRSMWGVIGWISHIFL